MEKREMNRQKNEALKVIFDKYGISHELLDSLAENEMVEIDGFDKMREFKKEVNELQDFEMKYHSNLFGVWVITYQ